MWPFLDGHVLITSGVDLETLEARRFIHAIAELFIQDGIGPAPEHKEIIEGRDRARAKLLRLLSDEEPGYDYTESYGSSNDSYGPTSDAPLPYLTPTDQTEDGYVGLDPPLG